MSDHSIDNHICKFYVKILVCQSETQTMKFLGLSILILCIYIGQVIFPLFSLPNSLVHNFLISFIYIQICSSKVEASDEAINENLKIIRKNNYGVSELLMDDVHVILDKFRNNSLMFEKITFGLVSGASLSNLAEIMLCSEHKY